MAPLPVLAWWLRQRTESWFSPAALFAAWWSVAMGGPLIAAPDFDVWLPAVLVAVIFVALFSLAAIAGERSARVAWGGEQPPRRLSMRVLRATVAAGAVLGVVSIQALVAVHGKSLRDLLDLATWIELGAQFSISRYIDDVDEPLLARLLSIGFFSGSLIGGVLWVRACSRLDRILALAPLVTALLYASVLTTRAVFLYAVMMFGAVQFAMRVYDGQHMRRLLHGRLILAVGLGLAFLVILVALLQTSRAGYDTLDQMADTINHIRVWFCGHISGFSAWYREYVLVDEPLHGGERTLGGLFQLLGLMERRRGVFVDYHSIGAGEVTNVYTIFRGLLEDFGLAGSVMLLIALGWGAGTLYVAALRKRLAAVAALALVYCVLLWSPFGSFMTYNTLLFSYVVFGLVLHLAARPASKGTAVAPAPDPRSCSP
ncbi:MAG TPA: O-antigen polymerase [Anaeromyxobacter sp.]|nr:O-antigen polymerase [Anaeromyxobacter sp.]